MRCFVLFVSSIFLFSPSILAQSSLQQELDSLRNRSYQRQESLLPLFKTVSVELDTTKNVSTKKQLQEKYDSIDKVMNQISVERLQSELAFVRRHPDSPIALEVLQFNLFRPESMMYYNVIDSFYSRISKPLKNTPTGKQLLKDLNNWRNSQVGRKAPSFVVKDLKRRSLSLKDFYNKNYVLIDFWASWCLPCREEFPNLKQAYAKYQSKGLQIINASIDEDLVKWKAAIYKDGIQSWKHFAVKENKPSVSSLYFVIGVPTKVLIDKQGRIIERWVGSTPEYTEALKNKLKTIFK